jgi:hypothetical protein
MDGYVAVLRPCRFDLSVFVAWSGQKKGKAWKTSKKKEKLIEAANTALKC